MSGILGNFLSELDAIFITIAAMIASATGVLVFIQKWWDLKDRRANSKGKGRKSDGISTMDVVVEYSQRDLDLLASEISKSNANAKSALKDASRRFKQIIDAGVNVFSLIRERQASLNYTFGILVGAVYILGLQAVFGRELRIYELISCVLVLIVIEFVRYRRLTKAIVRKTEELEHLGRNDF